MKSKVITSIVLTLFLASMLTITSVRGVCIRDQKLATCLYYDISSIAVDDDCIWFGTGGNGVFCYNKTTSDWSIYNTTNSGIASNYIRSVAVDGNHVWFGTQNMFGTPGGIGKGVSRYNKISRIWTTFNRTNSGLAGRDNVKSIVVDGNYVWFGVSKGGVSKYNKANNTWTVYNSTNSGLVNDFVSSMAIDGDEVWIGTNAQYTLEWGISRFNQTSGTWTTYVKGSQSANHVISISVDKDIIWFGTNGGGVFAYNKTIDTWTKYTQSPQLANYVMSISVDRDLVWFGTENGASKYNKTNRIWTTYDITNSSLIDKSVGAIAVDDPYVWFGTLYGISRYNKETGEWACWSSAPIIIKIISPQSTIYTTTSIPLTFIIDNSTPISWIWCTLDRQPNITITGNTTLTGLSDGPHAIMIYANDTSGNIFSPGIVSFTVAPAVGGTILPIKKLEFLIPYIGVISVILVTITVVVKKRRLNFA